jgi:hypothetical protein
MHISKSFTCNAAKDMEIVYLRKYVREYLQPHKSLVRKAYCRTLKETLFKMVNSLEFDQKILASTYNITFNLFRDVLNGTPLRYTEVMMVNLEESYNNPQIRLNDDLADFPDGLMRRYSLLFQVIAGFTPNYSSDLKTNHKIIQELEYLEGQIEYVIRENNKKRQRKAL